MIMIMMIMIMIMMIIISKFPAEETAAPRPRAVL